MIIILSITLVLSIILNILLFKVFNLIDNGLFIRDNHKIFAKNLSKSGYFDYDRILDCLKTLSEREINELSWICYRASEKCGHNIFDSENVIQ
jgi:hypothetical protein